MTLLLIFAVAVNPFWASFMRVWRGQREKARQHWALALEGTETLLSDTMLFDSQARQIITLATMRQGELARRMLLLICLEIITGRGGRRDIGHLHIKLVPVALRALYVETILHFTLADAYRSTFAGRIWRSFNSWTLAAAKDRNFDPSGPAIAMLLHRINMATPRTMPDGRGPPLQGIRATRRRGSRTLEGRFGVSRF